MNILELFINIFTILKNLVASTLRAMHKLHKQEYGGGYPILIEVYFVKLVSDDGG